MNEKILVFDLDDTLITYVKDEEIAKASGRPYAEEYVSSWNKKIYEVLRPFAEEVLEKAAKRFDRVMLWTYHVTTRDEVESLLERLSIRDKFDRIITKEDNSLNNDRIHRYSTYKSLENLASEYKTSIENTAIIQDCVWGDANIIPKSQWIFVKSYNPEEKNHDDELLKAYNKAVELVFRSE